MRPLYETEDDRRIETETISAVLSQRWPQASKQWDVRKLPIKNGMDYAICDASSRVMFMAEIKNRPGVLQYPSYYISAHKHRTAVEWDNAYGVPTHLFLRDGDVVKYMSLSRFRTSTLMVWGNRDRGDWQDQELSIKVPWDAFEGQCVI